ncbi:MAG: DUF3349 domain-containing protein [Leucobacter sp.]
MSDGIIAQVLRWLRAGYPEGVPPKDYTPLLALLRRSLEEEDFEAVLAEIEHASPDPVRLRHIREAIANVSDAAPDSEEMRAVADRLLQAGLPVSDGVRRLAEGEGSAETSPIDAVSRGTSLLAQALGWLQIGYPQGVPPKDRVPLLALFRRRLTDREVHEVARALAAAGEPDIEVSSVEAQVLMMKVLDGLPSEEDIERVRAHLVSRGYEVA